MDVVLPKNSLTMTEAEVVEWYVAEGGEMVAGEPLFLMETEKSQVVVDAAVSGRLLKIRCQPGSQAAAGEVIAVVDTGQADSSFAGSSTVKRTVAPAAAELAGQLGIDIDSVRGTGSGGRVIEEDVLQAAQSTVAPATGQPTAKSAAVGVGRPASHAAVFSKARGAGNRATVAAAEVPTFQLSVLVDIPSAGRPDRATASDLLVAAAAAAVRRVPAANAFVDDQGDVQLYDEVRIGLLVRADDALLPLVFADPDRSNLAEMHDLRKKWMSHIGTGALPTEATYWPTIVVSNIGRATVRWFSAVLFPGTALTMAVGGVGAQQPGKAEIVLTCDHRIIDGVDAADYAAEFGDVLAAL